MLSHKAGWTAATLACSLALHGTVCQLTSLLNPETIDGSVAVVAVLNILVNYVLLGFTATSAPYYTWALYCSHSTSAALRMLMVCLKDTGSLYDVMGLNRMPSTQHH